MGRLKEKKLGRLFVNIAKAGLLVVAVLVIAESICIISGASKKPEGNETVVVLGSKVNLSGPSLMTARRLDAALEYMNAHPDAVCVLSGGQGHDEPFSEAYGMSEYLIKRGIDAKRLYLEDRSTNTRENLKYTMELIEKEGLNDHIAIVSNEFHLYRAGIIAKEYGISYRTIAGHSVSVLFPTYFIRELYAILAEWILY